MNGMNGRLSRVIICAAWAWAGVASAEVVYLAELTGFTKQREYQVLNEADMATLTKTVEAESRVYPRALDLVRQEWEKPTSSPAPVAAGTNKTSHASASGGVKKVPFPSGGVVPRKVMNLGMFMSSDEANKRKKDLEKRNAAESAQPTITITGPSAKGAPPPTAKQPPVDQEMHAQAQRAADMLKQKIAELLKPAPTASPAK